MPDLRSGEESFIQGEQIYENISRRAFPKSSIASAAAPGGTGTAPAFADAEGTEEYYLPGQSVWTLWDNPRNNNEGKPFVIRPGERVTIVSIQGCGVIRKLWMSMNYIGKALFPRARERNTQVWIECFWDAADQPAISAPVGDFFGHIMGRDHFFRRMDKRGRAAGIQRPVSAAGAELYDADRG